MTTIITVAISTIVIFPISEAGATDLIDGMVESGIKSGYVQSITSINYVLLIYQTILLGSFGIAYISSAGEKDKNKYIVVACSDSFTIFFLIILSAITMFNYPGFDLSVSTIFIAPAMFSTYILRDIGIFVLITGITIILSALTFDLLFNR